MIASAVTAAGLLLVDERTTEQGPLMQQADAVRTMLLAERTAKDLGHWDVMAAAFASDASVRVSWFQGSGTDFVASARARARRGRTPSFHEIGAVTVVVNGDRALPDAPCAVHIRGSLGGVDAVSRGRVCWRADAADRIWRVASMDMIYFRDTLSPAHAGTALPPLRTPDPATPGDAVRPSYRFFATAADVVGPPRLPGPPGDRPSRPGRPPTRRPQRVVLRHPCGGLSLVEHQSLEPHTDPATRRAFGCSPTVIARLSARGPIRRPGTGLNGAVHLAGALARLECAMHDEMRSATTPSSCGK